MHVNDMVAFHVLWWVGMSVRVSLMDLVGSRSIEVRVIIVRREAR
jgi:hypothetical protein